MGQKLSFNDTTKFLHSLPGPGTHEANATFTRQKSPVYSMGARFNQQKDTTSIVPGPGAYVNTSERNKGIRRFLRIA